MATTRSIYVPLKSADVPALAEMADHYRRSIHEQAAWLISEAVDRWKTEQHLEQALREQSDPLEEVPA